ncbi:MAG: hypothetical protein Q8R36_03745 [bacterium]|nr:hypothetical protein [bacterium]
MPCLQSPKPTISREELASFPTPLGTDTHRPIPHAQVIGTLIETLGFRHIGVHRDEYAISKDGNKMFGILDLEMTVNGCRLVLGIRNSHDKTMRLSLAVGYRVLVSENLAFHRQFVPLLAKHSKHFSLQNAVSIGVDETQRNFDPMMRTVETLRGLQITDELAKILIYRAFIEGELAAPKHLGTLVHQYYFHSPYEEFVPRTMWSLLNAFTGSFQVIDPIPRFKALASLSVFF